MLSLELIKDYLVSVSNLHINACDQIGLANSGKRNTLTFLDDERFIEEAKKNSNIKGVLACPSLGISPWDGVQIIPCNEPRFALYKLLEETAVDRPFEATSIDDAAQLGDNVCISDCGVIIRSNVHIEDNVTIGPWTYIGDNTVIRSGTRIGMEGLERKVARNGDVLFISHRGGVRIAEYAQIGPNVVIDRGISADSDTIIGKYAAIGALSHIAHGVKLGDRVFAAANTIVCGSAVIGDDVWLGPGSVVTNSVSIGSNARVEIASTALKNVEDSGRVFGIKVFGRQWVGNTSS